MTSQQFHTSVIISSWRHCGAEYFLLVWSDWVVSLTLFFSKSLLHHLLRGSSIHKTNDIAQLHVYSLAHKSISESEIYFASIRRWGWCAIPSPSAFLCPGHDFSWWKITKTTQTHTLVWISLQNKKPLLLELLEMKISLIDQYYIFQISFAIFSHQKSSILSS